ncbi:hypothetical protein BHM03_00032883, partial [Ensete ventricosum]
MGPIFIIRGLTTVKGLEGVELLDTLITYLWRIHGLDYYGMSETSEAKGKAGRLVKDETVQSGRCCVMTERVVQSSQRDRGPGSKQWCTNSSERRVFRVCASKLASNESIDHQYMGAVYHRGRSQIASTSESHGGDLIIQ